jgi:prepilin-type N-terminal cleavage/methylation domain-containing protein
MNFRPNNRRKFRIPNSEFRIRNLKFDIRHLAAFTLIELLVVIAIIALLAGIGAPLLRGLNKSNAMVAANRQLLDDLAYARQRAISDHTTVYVLFVPPCPINLLAGSVVDTDKTNMLSNLYGGQYTTYALYADRSIGDQPGRSSPRYLTPWRTLPEGVFFSTNKFNSTKSLLSTPIYSRSFRLGNFPFPTICTNTTPARAPLYYLSFNYQGQLTDGLLPANPVSDEIIPLARGSVLYARDAAGNFLNQPADLLETPPHNSENYQPVITNSLYNAIHIDWLTGRARVELQTVQ